MESLKRHLNNSSVAIFAVTAIAYVAAFIYEVAYLSVLGIDWRFAQVQIPALITSLASVGFSLFMVDYLFTTIKTTFADINLIKANPYLYRLVLSEFRQLKIFIFPLLISIFVFGGDSSDFHHIFKLIAIGFLIVFISQLGLTWAPILFNTIRHKSLNDAIKKFYIETDKRHAKEKEIAIGTWVDPLSTYIYPALIVWFVAYIGGQALATGDHKFSAFTDKKGATNVIVKVYSDEVITKELDLKSSKLKDGFKVVGIKAINGTIKDVDVKVQGN